MIFVSTGRRGLARFVEYSPARSKMSRGIDLSKYKNTPCIVMHFNAHRNTLTVLMADGLIRDDIIREELEEWK